MNCVFGNNTTGFARGGIEKQLKKFSRGYTVLTLDWRLGIYLNSCSLPDASVIYTA